jgi:hypothetical protein
VESDKNACGLENTSYKPYLQTYTNVPIYSVSGLAPLLLYSSFPHHLFLYSSFPHQYSVLIPFIHWTVLLKTPRSRPCRHHYYLRSISGLSSVLIPASGSNCNHHTLLRRFLMIRFLLRPPNSSCGLLPLLMGAPVTMRCL